jgi:small-conductance mechanosensitive channel/CRP-like cAMP-binding protein
VIWASLGIIVLLLLELGATPEIRAHLTAAHAALTVEVTTIALIVAVAVFIDALIRRFYWRGHLAKRRNRDTPALIQDIITILLVTVALSIGLSVEAGLSIGSIVTASGATAIVLGIALQAVIQDLFSGLAVNLDGSYGLGDWLTIYSDQIPEPIYGRVSGITWRSTFLTLEDGRRVMVPNHLVTANPVMNHSAPREPKRLTVSLEIDNRIPADRVKDMLLGEAFKMTRRTGLARQPAPVVLIGNLTAEAVRYDVRFYHDPHVISPSIAESIVRDALLDVMQQNKLPTPVSQVELTKPPDLEFELGEEEERSVIARAPLFQNVLETEHVDILVSHCKAAEISVGTVLMKQGDPGGSMFIIMEGAASVSITNAAGQTHEVNILATGDVVGEMSLMTGAPRTATVAALTEMRVLEVSKDAIEVLLRKSPVLAERFSNVLADRTQQNVDHAQRTTARAEVQQDFLNRIMKFFSQALS